MDAVTAGENWRKFYEETISIYKKDVERLRAERASLQEQIGRMWAILRRRKLIEEYHSDDEED